MRTNELALEFKIEMFELALINSYKHYSQILDCSESYMRKPYKITFQEVISMASKVIPSSFSFWTCCLRDFILEDIHYEFCVSAMNDGKEYFIWIEVPVELGKILISKYGVEV